MQKLLVYNLLPVLTALI